MSMNSPKFSYSPSEFRLDLDLENNKSDKARDFDNTDEKPVGIGNDSFDYVLKTAWEAAQSKGLFRYQIKNLPTKVLSGKYGFILQLNPDRAQKRRKPQQISSLQQPFNSEEFNFSKVKPEEILLELKPLHKKKQTSSETSNGKTNDEENLLIINVSPLEFGHVLLTPFRSKNNPQKVSLDGLRLAIELALLSQSCDFRVGFNSLCGHASVNHEHYHAYYLKHRLYLEFAEIVKIKGACYELVDYPGPGFAFVLASLAESAISDFTYNVLKLTSYFQDNDIAHNIFITRGSTLSQKGHFDSLRVFVWARQSSFGSKGCDAFNPALCELGGHFPCKNATAYETLTEDFIVKELSDICKENYTKVRSVIEELL